MGGEGEKTKRSLIYILILMVLVAIGGVWFLYSTFVKMGELSKGKVAPTYPPSVDLYSVCFADQNNVWAVGEFGTLVHSVDGGKTWKKGHISGVYENLIDVFFIDSRIGWAMTPWTLFKTENGGGSWKKVKEFPRPMCRIRFFDSKYGWVVGEEIILHTSDGGVTWIEQHYEGEPAIFRDISILSRKEAWIGGERGVLLYTNDGGRSWKARGPQRAGTIFSIGALDSLNIWTAGIAGEIFRTRNGGDTWVAIDFPTKRNIYCIMPITKEKALVCGDGILNMTFLGGRDWRGVLVDKDISYKWIYDIGRSGENIVAVGQGGEFAILYSFNKGKTWKAVKYD